MNKWMTSWKQSQIFLTHIFIPQQTKTHVNGIRSSWVSWQFPGLSSTVICSCKCSTGPSGKPCPKNGCAAWSTPRPTMDLMPAYHLQNTDTKDELSSQTKSTDHWCFPTRMYSVCFYTNENTHTFWTRNFYMVAQTVAFVDFVSVFSFFPCKFCIFLFIYLFVFYWKGQHFPALCLQGTDAFRYRDIDSSASANALWLMPSVHRCSTLLRISCPSSSRVSSSP